MIPSKADVVVEDTSVQDVSNEQSREHLESDEMKSRFWSRNRYTGAVLVKLIAFLLPALYNTLSKLWVANINSSMVVTVDAYTYIGVLAETINEGLPRAAWVIIGDKSSRTLSSRIGLTHTLILFQSVVGLLVTIILIAAAKSFAAGFVPIEVRNDSLTYIRLSAFSVFSGAIEYAIANATRALDHPDVPLIISTTRFAINIVLDLILISKFHVGTFTPTTNIQAAIRLACDMSAAFAGLVSFIVITVRLRKKHSITSIPRPSVRAFTVLLRPGIMTFTESAVRNAFYLWLISNIVSMGSEYATAWGIFNTIRWGLVMVPVQTFEASALAFVGHRWGKWRREVGIDIVTAKATWKDIKYITHPALLSLLLSLTSEIPICLLLSLHSTATTSFARYLSNSIPTAELTAHMWRTLDWCYIFYAAATQLATILLATTPRWYLAQSLAANLLYVLPWAVVCQVKALDARRAWMYHSVVFGGSLVVGFACVCVVLAGWVWRLRRGVLHVGRVKSA